MAAENKPEGLKKIRNPDRMYRSAVCYSAHAPPNSVSDDTETNNEHGHLKIYLPKKLLECLPKCSTLPKERHRWNTNEEIAAYLITFEKHEEWLTTSPKTRPQNGSMILYNRKKVKYRKDGYCWKKRKDGKTTREDHMKLKVQGVECLYGCYVHSSIIPTFHRRCYWLLQNPDIVLVHYLNVPAIEDCGKPCGPILCSINTDKKEWAKWTKEELIGQLKPMFHGIKWTCSNGNSSSGFSVEQLVQQILDSHQTKPPPRTHNCLCTGTQGAGSSVHHKCNSAKHRIISPKVDPRSGGYSSTHSELQNNDVSEGKTEHSQSSKNRGGTGGGSVREKRNGKVHKPVLLHQNSTEVSSTNQVEVPDTTQNSPVSISSGLNSDPDMADSPAVTGMGHVASVMSSLSQSVFMSEVTGDPVYSMSPTGGPNTHIMGGSLQLLQYQGGFPGLGAEHEEVVGMDQNRNVGSGQAGATENGTDGLLKSGDHLQACAGGSGENGGADHFMQQSSENGPIEGQGQGGSLQLLQYQGGFPGLGAEHEEVVGMDQNRNVGSARALPSLPSSQHDWLSLDDNQFRMSILERLEQMERRMAEMAGQQQQGCGGTAGTGGGGGDGGANSQSQCISGQAGSSFESRVVVVCEKMMNRACWAKSKHLIHSKTFRGMTLLHLAAGQGYATLIQTLIKWRTKHADSIDLELEVDPLNVDHFSCTPLMWACALGHLEAAVVLYKWDRRALAIPDSLGRLPLFIARSRGHTKLAECLEQLQREEQQQQQTPSSLPPTSSMSFSPNPDIPTSNSWMVSWGSDSMVAPSRQNTGTATTTTTPCTNQNPDLRRPRSEPSSYYSNECQRDLPLAKKHKPNPEFVQGQLDKHMSVSLNIEQQTHKLSTSPKALPSTPSSPDKSVSEEGLGTVGILQAKMASYRGGHKWGTREVLRKSSISGTGKEKLASRLRQRGEPLSMLGMVEREMVDTEILSYKEDLENQNCLSHMEDLQANMMSLAEHIIEATPERIKREHFPTMESVPLDNSGLTNTMCWLASYLGDVEHLPGIIHLSPIYSEPLTPPSNPSLSPGNSPMREGPFEKPTLPAPSEWSEFLRASNSKVERELAQLTLSDPEQRELYEAARLVQTAFRKYKGRPLREQQEVATSVIQRCYRKYKQLTWIALKYALYKKMTQAAILIQSKFRSYHEQKKFQQSRRAAVLIQQCYRSYRKFGRLRPHRRAATAAKVQHKLRSSLLTKRQDQAARKIMRFLRHCRHSPLMDHRLFKRSERIEKGQGT
ncbi:calmodulin-binding transcription activator 1-like [Sinocyclocheilus grahami]|uniref:calmodulin-binding transcription activator 1-like n=1 Tax=Sinocyclocheilus grahami TaxID=75366 RepID=UPI0007ACB4F4|nr:PREDICTED: calmodulin-binding transcription activator 1-like [Sinocyclocheilus grahami]